MEQEEKDSEGSSLFAATFDNPGASAPVPAEAGQPEAAPDPAPPEEKGDPAPEAEAGQPRDEAGRFASKPKDAETAVPPAAEREPQNVPVAALKDERSKRQAAEAELAQARAFIAQMQRQPQAQPVPQQPAEKPDPIGAMLDNPEGFVEQRAQQVARQLVAPLEQQMFADRLHHSIARAQGAEDFAECDALVNAALQAAPQEIQQRLAAEMRRHPDPGQWVLQQGRALKERAAFQAWKQQQAQPAAPAPVTAPATSHAPLPASLATARGVGASRPTDNTAGSPLTRTWRD